MAQLGLFNLFRICPGSSEVCTGQTGRKVPESRTGGVLRLGLAAGGREDGDMRVSLEGRKCLAREHVAHGMANERVSV